MDQSRKFKAVKFSQYGGIDVLHIDELPVPSPGKGQVLVRVKAAGINPGESAIREGLMAERWPATFPSGQGSDFAGIIELVGPEVQEFASGDEVIGYTDNRASQAEFVVTEVGKLIRRPAHVPWEQAGALFVAGTTAHATIKSVGLKKGETLVVSGAAGGVGSVVVQLARNLGARVIGLASKPHHSWLNSHDVLPLEYGGGLADRIRGAAGGRVDAFIDTHGDGYVKMALELGVPPDRIDTIIDFRAAKKYNTHTDGNAEGARPEVLSELADQMEKGRLEIPISGTYPLGRVKDAYKELETHHTLGKIVLVP